MTRSVCSMVAGQTGRGDHGGWFSAVRVLSFWVPLLMWPAALSLADEFAVGGVRTDLIDGVYRLSANIDYALSADAREALENGVPLGINVEIEVRRRRAYLWDEAVASLVQRYQLSYHALSDQYIVVNFNSGVRESYPTYGTAMAALGRIDNLPVLDNSLLDAQERYDLHLRTRLDIEALPAPLRPWAWFSSSWRLSSPWYLWPLQ